MPDLTRKCERKAVLLTAIQVAMGALTEIHNEEVAALLKNDFDTIDQLRAKLQAVRDHKNSLIDLYRTHVTSHGC